MPSRPQIRFEGILHLSSSGKSPQSELSKRPMQHASADELALAGLKDMAETWEYAVGDMQCCHCRNTSCAATCQLSACVSGCPAASRTGTNKVLPLRAWPCSSYLYMHPCTTELAGSTHREHCRTFLCAPIHCHPVIMLKCHSGCSSRRLKERLAELHARKPAPAPSPQPHAAQVLSNRDIMPSALEHQPDHHEAAARQDKDCASAGKQTPRHSSLSWLQRLILSFFQAPQLRDSMLRREPAVRTRHAL